jgi:prostaglandin-H2 D-isomerase / glutathione transferase
MMNVNSVVKTLGSSPPLIRFRYFPIEGFGECVRLALVLSGTPFIDEHVSYQDWFKNEKSKTPYGNLPVIILDNDETKMRTQSKAMLRWIGVTFSSTLYPMDRIFDIEEAIGVVEDLVRVFYPVWLPFLSNHDEEKNHEYYRNTEEGKKDLQRIREKFVTKELPVFLQYISDLIEKNGKGHFLASVDEPTIADCVAVPLLRGFTKGVVDYLPSSCLDQHPKIVAYIKRFCSLEPIRGRYTDGIY